jgi:hypothetical protein
MKSIFLVLLGLGLSVSAHSSTFQCNLQDEPYEDYAVEVNLAVGKAAFFDNDNWVIISQKQSVGGNYVFDGKDSYGDVVKVEFNPNRQKQGYVRFRVGGKTTFVTISCKAVRRSSLNSGI